jgi:hypothetical protein
MKPTTRIKTVTPMLLGALALCLSAAAQQTAPSAARRLAAYDLKREVSLLGTVVKYESSSSTLPMGAHLVVETASGQVDVHLGNGKALEAHHLALNPGDSVRIVGEDLALGSGTIFAARIVQKGAQAVAVRNSKGFLTPAVTAMSPSQTEALRGVR